MWLCCLVLAAVSVAALVTVGLSSQLLSRDAVINHVLRLINFKYAYFITFYAIFSTTSQ